MLVTRSERVDGAISSPDELSESPAKLNLTAFTKAQIVGAVVLAKSKIRRLVKSERNLDEAYAFASIDSFLEHVNPICVEAGLVVLMDEVAVADGSFGARQDQNHWLRITYDITLAHVSGETLGPFRRHVDIPRTGPQAFGAAQSYVLKQFLRAQFQIATGEADDPDFGTKASGRAGASDRPNIRAPRPETPRPEGDSLDIGGLRGCAQRIKEASSGRKLLSVLASLADDMIAHPMLKAARLQALTRIVSTAQTVAALEKLEQHFSGDWEHVADEAEHRRLELDLLDSRAEEEFAARAAWDAASGGNGIACSPQSPLSLDPGDPALNPPVPAIPDALCFGDIPYHEAAA